MRIEKDLKECAANCADFAESTMKLQQAYLKKRYPQQYAHSTEVSQPPQDVPNTWFGGKVPGLLFRGRQEDLGEPEPSKFEGIFVSSMGSDFVY
jgi:hypothetical protein